MMPPPYIPFQAWACTRDVLADCYLRQCRFLVSLGAPLPKLLMSIFSCHGSLN